MTQKPDVPIVTHPDMVKPIQSRQKQMWNYIVGKILHCEKTEQTPKQTPSENEFTVEDYNLRNQSLQETTNRHNK